MTRSRAFENSSRVITKQTITECRGFSAGLSVQREMDIKSLIIMETLSSLCLQRYFKAHDRTSDAVLKSPYLVGDMRAY